MSADPSSSALASIGRTGHACVQCRSRKQKCGGITYAVKCRTCTTRKVKCSFEDEVKDPRYNPYLRLRSSPSPAVSLEQGEPDEGHFAHLASASAPSINHLAPFDGGNAQALLSSVPAAPAIPSSINDGLAKEVDSLKSRIADLEKGLSTAQKSHDENIGTPRSRALTSFMLPPDVGSSHQGYQVAPEASLGSISSNGFSSPQGVVITDGPLKTVNNFQKDIPLDFQSQDPIARSIVTQGEAHVMFRLFFSSCHSNAPFLDVGMDSDVDRVRSTSVLLFLAILCVGARFWSASSKTPCWLHPRYPELIRLLDAEVMRVTLRPGPDDQKLETVQALMLCAHWIPFDLAADRKRYRSRFSEGGAWQCLGLAIRWATSLALERSCHVPFQRPETVTRTDVRRFRTMLYLIESDHYLALSARRSSHLNPEPLHAVLDTFLQGNYVQDTDIRLASLFRTAYGAHFTGCRPTTIESVEAFDKDVQLIEQHFASSPGDRSRDSLAQHFPFTSLRWYRLSYACAFLDVTDLSQRSGKALTWALEWASQILLHLSRPPSLSPPNNMNIPAQLEPDPNVVNIMSFAIDHYLVVIAYAAFFLVSSWLSNSTDLNLRPHVQQSDTPLGEDASSSLLFRLVDVAARTLEAASPPEGHLARRYSPLLRGMTDIILSGNTQAQRTNGEQNAVMTDTNDLPDQLQSSLEGDLWEMWQQTGLDANIWPSMFDDMYEGR